MRGSPEGAQWPEDHSHGQLHRPAAPLVLWGGPGEVWTGHSGTAHQLGLQISLLSGYCPWEGPPTHGGLLASHLFLPVLEVG